MVVQLETYLVVKSKSLCLTEVEKDRLELGIIKRLIKLDDS